MVAEVLIGRSTQSSPVAAFQKLTRSGSGWVLLGWMGVLTGFLILSYYSVVAGWTIHYVLLAVKGAFVGASAEAIAGRFDALKADAWANVGYHGLFMALTVAVVIGGVRSGIERWSRILMPTLFLMLVGLMLYALFLPGFGAAASFVFAPHTENFTAGSLLKALGQAFYSLSLGMGAMLTYGSYLSKDSGIAKSSVLVAVLDSLIATLASLVVFPITFSFGMQAEAGPGLIFKSIPVAFSQMTGGYALAIVFFVLIGFAALTSAMSLQEVVTSSFIDLYGWGRRKVCILTGAAIFLFGVPSAMAGGRSFFGAGLKALSNKSFFDWVDHLTANWLLPAGGLLIAIFTGFMFDSAKRREEFLRGSEWPNTYDVWLPLLRYVVPFAVALVFAQSSGLLGLLGIEWK
jgi:NSS family neurotransmitter:Na+ symporter